MKKEDKMPINKGENLPHISITRKVDICMLKYVKIKGMKFYVSNKVRKVEVVGGFAGFVKRKTVQL